MIIVDPVSLGDAACTRASVANYWDKTGALQQAGANELRVTYSPEDLGAAPYALAEPATVNAVRNNTMQGAVVGTLGLGGSIPTNWQLDTTVAQKVDVVAAGTIAGMGYIDVRFYSANNDRAYLALYQEPIVGTGVPAAAAQIWAASMFVKQMAGTLPPDSTLNVRALNGGGGEVGTWGTTFTPAAPASSLAANRVAVTSPALPAATTGLTMFYLAAGLPIGGAYDFTLRLALPQLERDQVTSPIKTTGAALARAADVINTVAGLVYSNVAEPEALWVAGTSYAAQARVRLANHDLYESLIANNVGNDPAAAASAGKWLKVGKTNRWAQFDDQNNTQTSNPEEILFVVSPRAISQGLFLGNVDGTEVRVSMTDLSRGLVYREVQSQIVSSSKSSFFRWAFKRIRRRTYFLTLKLPVFANPLVTVLIRRPGATAKCGMAMVGPAIDIGLSHYGLSTEIKDFSSTTFNPDGTSATVVRGYAKRMSVDVSVDNDQVDDVEEQLIGFRQKVVVYVGTVLFGSAMLVGKFSSFKKVIASHPESKMALQIEGVV